MTKVSLYLITQKGYEVLKYLTSQGKSAHIDQVIVGRDAAIENDFAAEIIDLCTQFSIDFHERKDDFEIRSAYSIAISWRWLIHEENSKLIVLHDSLLPKYRGFAPLVNCLINKEPKIGVTALFASEAYDEGDILLQRSTAIEYPIKIKEAIDLVAVNYIEVIADLFQLLENGENFVGTPQDQSQASYSLWLDEEDYQINWNQSAGDIKRFIDATSSPYKGACTRVNGQEKIRITDAEVLEDVQIENRHIGKVIFASEGIPTIVCKTGLLKLTEVKYDNSGENALPFKKFRVRLG